MGEESCGDSRPGEREAVGLAHVEARSNHLMGGEKMTQMLNGKLEHSWLRDVDLADCAHDAAADLPYGRKRALEIATTLALDPELMLLDEPSAGLSPLLVKEIFQQLRRLCEGGLTLMVVEQNARSLLQWCDSAYILREGRVVFHGTAAAALAGVELVGDGSVADMLWARPAVCVLGIDCRNQRALAQHQARGRSRHRPHSAGVDSLIAFAVRGFVRAFDVRGQGSVADALQGFEETRRLFEFEHAQPALAASHDVVQAQLDGVHAEHRGIIRTRSPRSASECGDVALARRPARA